MKKALRFRSLRQLWVMGLAVAFVSTAIQSYGQIRAAVYGKILNVYADSVGRIYVEFEKPLNEASSIVKCSNDWVRIQTGPNDDRIAAQRMFDIAMQAQALAKTVQLGVEDVNTTTCVLRDIRFYQRATASAGFGGEVPDPHVGLLRQPGDRPSAPNTGLVPTPDSVGEDAQGGGVVDGVKQRVADPPRKDLDALGLRGSGDVGGS